MHREPATRYRLLFHRNDICSVSRTIVAEIYWKKNNQEILSKKLHEKRVDKSRWLSHFVALALASSLFSAFLLIFNYEDRLFCPTTTLQRFNARTYEKWWLFLFAQISTECNVENFVNENCTYACRMIGQRWSDSGGRSGGMIDSRKHDIRLPTRNRVLEALWRMSRVLLIGRR